MASHVTLFAVDDIYRKGWELFENICIYFSERDRWENLVLKQNSSSL